MYALVAHNAPFPMPPSTIVITPDGSEIYLCDESGGRIRRFGSSTGKNELPSIDVGGHPHRMLVGPRSGNIYVLDSQGSRVVVINPRTEEITYALTYVGHVSNSFALTPDERKLYISNEQPSPQATVTVVNLRRPDHQVHYIEGFNCPEGLAIVPDGSKLYVSTQCGAQHDPILVVDSQTDQIKKTIGDFAVGTADLAVANRGKRVYVSRGMSTPEDKDGNILNVPAQISAIDTVRDEKVESEKLATGNAFAVTPDSKFLLFANGTSIEIVNTETRATRSITVGLPIAGIAVGKPNRNSSTLVCYAWCPDRNFIFFTGLTGLLP